MIIEQSKCSKSVVSSKMDVHEKIVADLRDSFNSGKTRSYTFRKNQLKALRRMISENENEFYATLKLDLRKPWMESFLTEVNLMKRDIDATLREMKQHTKPDKGLRHLFTPPESFQIYHDPYGVVLIIGAWNYINLILAPLTGAIATGNCAVLKPSEVSMNSAKLIAKLIPQYLDPSCFTVVEGGAEETTNLLAQKFDYIFYTGSYHVGQIIHAAANKYLTPVTLELGGKCPVYVDSSTQLKMTAQRILWGKCTNLGQTCVAPDYILCTKEVEEKLVEQFKKVLQSFYGNDPQNSEDTARIINNRHFTRLQSLLQETKATVAIGGSTDPYDLWIEPTVFVNVKPNDALMKGEIFGPLLPILTVNSVAEAIEFINQRPKPLALYVFTRKSKVANAFVEQTQSGAVMVNDTVYHVGVTKLPFGGVGESGMGQYHGKWSFETFSRPRTVLRRKFIPLENLHSYEVRYPPYTQLKANWVKLMLPFYDHWFLYFDFGAMFWYTLCFVLGMFPPLVLHYFKLLPF